MKYPKPYKNCSKILQISTIAIQEEHTVINLPQVRNTHCGLQSIKCKPTKAWNEIKAKTSGKLNIGYWSKSRLSESLKKYYFKNGSSLF